MICQNTFDIFCIVGSAGRAEPFKLIVASQAKSWNKWPKTGYSLLDIDHILFYDFHNSFLVVRVNHPSRVDPVHKHKK